jgi:hypothetical protein
LTVNLAPEEVEMDYRPSAQFRMAGHDLVVSKIEDSGRAAASAALKRQSRAGAALAVCTLAVTNYAKTVSGLEDADSSEVILGGLGVGVSANKCRLESASVAAVDEAGRSVTLADDLERLRSQTEILEKVHARTDYVQKASKVLRLGLKFLH